MIEISTTATTTTKRRPLRILAIDPYPSGCQTLCACITELGHRAVAAYALSTAEALVRGAMIDATGDATIDVIIVEHSLPWCDGWGFVHRIRAWASTPAIVLGDCTPGPLDHVFAMNRPCSLDELEGVITRAGAVFATPVRS